MMFDIPKVHQRRHTLKFRNTQRRGGMLAATALQLRLMDPFIPGVVFLVQGVRE